MKSSRADRIGFYSHTDSDCTYSAVLDVWPCFVLGTHARKGDDIVPNGTSVEYFPQSMLPTNKNEGIWF